ncbi:MAG: hypothetical protein ACI9W4_000938 [Rhodothermales bacterium]|jgi:hypothetical protein
MKKLALTMVDHTSGSLLAATRLNYALDVHGGPIPTIRFDRNDDREIDGLSLGASGVIFTALLAGHLGYSIPGVGAITSATTSQVPVVAYAVAYPVALILMTLVGRILVGLL